MPPSGAGSDDEGPRRFDVELFIVHPTLAPAEISAALRLERQFAHRVGAPRKTPKGTLLSGNYRDTRRRYSVRHETRAQHFADKVAALVDCLEPRKAFLTGLRATGGEATVIVQFLDGYFSDVISHNTLVKLADLQLDLGIECFHALPS